ncbi:DNA repair protein [Dokdonia pacifica]|uniref:DNA repair protein RadC n=1 Tax=Dokdonia pacifica TaxID=1627892 RepID=A0A238VMH5_9FLAO|nr:JAB domain-containing protein [Dokdonia pacifica]GGG19926.1 DNA repair protein [Dokdonia pacifica]SNR35582.1 DNA repair protein RadC [Dokdonia pacifica]
MKPTKELHPLDISLCQEVHIHYKRLLYDETKKIRSSQSAQNIFRDFADADRLDYKEFFWVILLTNANQVIAISEISIGGTTGTLVNTKEIVQLALLTNTSGVIIAHNHPSGKLCASASDRKITYRIKKILSLLDIKLLDHIILTSESYTSFADEGWL